MANYLADLYRRDLSRLVQQIEAFSSEEMLWQTVPGITNPAGNLALHIEGNLREYIGRQLGRSAYSRRRQQEFAAKGILREELLERIGECRRLIPSVIESLDQAASEAEYPEVVLEKTLSVNGMLIHLYGHLNWHLGQIDYLRRTLSDHGAIERARL